MTKSSDPKIQAAEERLNQRLKEIIAQKVADAMIGKNDLSEDDIGEIVDDVIVTSGEVKKSAAGVMAGVMAGVSAKVQGVGDNKPKRGWREVVRAYLVRAYFVNKPRDNHNAEEGDSKLVLASKQVSKAKAERAEEYKAFVKEAVDKVKEEREEERLRQEWEQKKQNDIPTTAANTEPVVEKSEGEKALDEIKKLVEEVLKDWKSQGVDDQERLAIEAIEKKYQGAKDSPGSVSKGVHAAIKEILDEMIEKKLEDVNAGKGSNVSSTTVSPRSSSNESSPSNSSGSISSTSLVDDKRSDVITNNHALKGSIDHLLEQISTRATDAPDNRHDAVFKLINLAESEQEKALLKIVISHALAVHLLGGDKPQANAMKRRNSFGSIAISDTAEVATQIGSGDVIQQAAQTDDVAISSKEKYDKSTQIVEGVAEEGLLKQQQQKAAVLIQTAERARQAARGVLADKKDKKKKEEEGLAATKIQAALRGHLARSDLDLMKENVTKIQALARGYITREVATVNAAHAVGVVKDLLKRVNEKKDDEEIAALRAEIEKLKLQVSQKKDEGIIGTVGLVDGEGYQTELTGENLQKLESTLKEKEEELKSKEGALKSKEEALKLQKQALTKAAEDLESANNNVTAVTKQLEEAQRKIKELEDPNSKGTQTGGLEGGLGGIQSGVVVNNYIGGSLGNVGGMPLGNVANGGVIPVVQNGANSEQSAQLIALMARVAVLEAQRNVATTGMVIATNETASSATTMLILGLQDKLASLEKQMIADKTGAEKAALQKQIDELKGQKTEQDKILESLKEDKKALEIQHVKEKLAADEALRVANEKAVNDAAEAKRQAEHAANQAELKAAEALRVANEKAEHAANQAKIISDAALLAEQEKLKNEQLRAKTELDGEKKKSAEALEKKDAELKKQKELFDEKQALHRFVNFTELKTKGYFEGRKDFEDVVSKISGGSDPSYEGKPIECLNHKLGFGTLIVARYSGTSGELDLSRHVEDASSAAEKSQEYCSTFAVVEKKQSDGIVKRSYSEITFIPGVGTVRTFVDKDYVEKRASQYAENHNDVLDAQWKLAALEKAHKMMNEKYGTLSSSDKNDEFAAKLLELDLMIDQAKAALDPARDISKEREEAIEALKKYSSDVSKAVAGGGVIVDEFGKEKNFEAIKTEFLEVLGKHNAGSKAEEDFRALHKRLFDKYPKTITKYEDVIAGIRDYKDESLLPFHPDRMEAFQRVKDYDAAKVLGGFVDGLTAEEEKILNNAKKVSDSVAAEPMRLALSSDQRRNAQRISFAETQRQIGQDIKKSVSVDIGFTEGELEGIAENIVKAGRRFNLFDHGTAGFKLGGYGVRDGEEKLVSSVKEDLESIKIHDVGVQGVSIHRPYGSDRKISVVFKADEHGDFVGDDIAIVHIRGTNKFHSHDTHKYPRGPFFHKVQVVAGNELLKDEKGNPIIDPNTGEQMRGGKIDVYTNGVAKAEYHPHGAIIIDRSTVCSKDENGDLAFHDVNKLHPNDQVKCRDSIIKAISIEGDKRKTAVLHSGTTILQTDLDRELNRANELKPVVKKGDEPELESVNKFKSEVVAILPNNVAVCIDVKPSKDKKGKDIKESNGGIYLKDMISGEKKYVVLGKEDDQESLEKAYEKMGVKPGVKHTGMDGKPTEKLPTYSDLKAKVDQICQGPESKVKGRATSHDSRIKVTADDSVLNPTTYAKIVAAPLAAAVGKVRGSSVGG